MSHLRTFPTTLPTTIASALLLAVAAAFTLLAAPAGAVPPGGPGPSTPGTSSSLGATTVTAGGTLGFTVRGYPGGETLYIKIDNEGYCASPPFGACVYHQQVIGANGTVSGTISLPAGLPAGRHTLRFLASEVGDSGELIGYTRESPTFTVTAPGTNGGDNGDTNGGTTTGGSTSGGTTSGTSSGTTSSTDATVTSATDGAAGGTDTAAGESQVLAAPAPATAAPTAEAGTVTGAEVTSAAPALVAPQVQVQTGDLVPMPWIGLYVLLGCLLVSSVLTTVAVLRRR